MKIKKMAVPVDFSEYSDKAAEFGQYLAQQFHSEITFIHVVALFEGNVIDSHDKLEEFVSAQERAAQQKMNETTARFDQHPMALRSEILRGFSPADTILEFTSNNDIDLIVMGTHGSGGLRHFLVGSIAEKVVRHSPVPVLTVHRNIDKKDVKKILVPIDFSEHSKQSILSAVSLANKFDSHICFLHVVELDFLPDYYSGGITEPLILETEIDEQSSEALEDFVGIHESYVSYATKRGRAYHEIVEYAQDNVYDLIVMATRGLSGLDHVLLGSTTERVVRFAQCPVLTIERNSNRNE